jgi:hypothetical protein
MTIPAGGTGMPAARCRAGPVWQSDRRPWFGVLYHAAKKESKSRELV